MIDVLDGVRDHYRAVGLTERLKTALMVFGPEDHQLLMQAGIDGLRDILKLSLDELKARLARAAIELNMEMPPDIVIEGWWEQAKTLEEA